MNSTSSSEHILVVEDDVIAQVGLRTILRAYGYEVEVVPHAGEAIQRIQSGLRPSLMFLDMIVPTFDDWQFFGKIMKDPSLTVCPVIIMTGLGVACNEWAHSLGAADLLRKPINIEDMLEKVGRIVVVV